MTNKISVWIVLNDKGQYLGFNYVTKAYEFMKTSKGDTFSHESLATDLSGIYGGRVVELVEKAGSVEVGKAAGELLTSLKEEVGHGSTTHSANYYVTKLKCQHDMSIEDIFRALDVGWTVKQPQRWYVKAPREWAPDEKTSWFYKDLDGDINTMRDSSRSRTSNEQFTAEEIYKYHLDDFEKVEVEDHEQ